MSSERINPLNPRLSRRALLKAAALALAAGRENFSARAEDDPYTARYEAFPQGTYEGMKAPEGRVNMRYKTEEAGDIIYGYAQEIISEQDGLTIDLARGDFLLTTEENRLTASGELSAEIDEPIDLSGDIEFHMELASDSDGQLSLDSGALEIDGPFAFDLLNPEGVVENRVGDDPNAFFVEYLNKAYQKRFGDEVRATDARVLIYDGFVDIEITREDL